MKIQLAENWELTGSYSGFWEFGRSMELKMELKGFMPWIAAEVPGSVHWDLHQAGILPDPYWDLNSLACEWVNERDWLYRVTFNADVDWQRRKVRLVCEGIDYAAKIRLNGQHIHEHTGMFTPAIIDISSSLQYGEENALLIGVSKSPDGVGQLGYTSKVSHLKSRFSYKWDFCPRLINMGLWKPVHLWITGRQWFNDVRIRTEVHFTGVTTSVHVTLESEAVGQANLSAIIRDPDGTVFAHIRQIVQTRSGLQTVILQVPIEKPQFWWPNGYGKQPLYQLEMNVWNVSEGFNEDQPSDQHTVSFGIRKLEFAQNPGAPQDSQALTVRVNDRSIYLKGWNWVPTDQLYGREMREQYEKLIQLAKQANVNLLRVWGGGLIEREFFYDLCDQAGIMVWQEMMQSSSGFNNEPSTETEFMDLLGSTMRHVICEKRNHPSLVIWCGGNELTEGGHLQDRLVPLTDRHPTLKLLRDLVTDMDSERLYLPTSPTGPMFFLEASEMGNGVSYDVHGPWKYGGTQEHYALYNHSDALLHSEYGGDGFASLTSLLKFLPEERLNGDQSDSRSWLHHGYEYWNMDDQLKLLFGIIDQLEIKIQLAQWLQAEGIRYAVESNRRRTPQCSGSILWQLNEPFPNISCTSAVDYYGNPKLVYSWVARANRALHVSMKYEKIAFMPGEPFSGTIFLTNDDWGLKYFDHGAMLHWCIRDSKGNVLQENRRIHEINDMLTQELDQIDWTIPEGIQSFFVIIGIQDKEGQAISGNEYSFAVRQSQTEEIPELRAFLDIPRTSITMTETQQDGGLSELRLQNTGDYVAMWTRIECHSETGDIIRPLQDGLLIFPGESCQVELDSKPSNVTWKIYGLNIEM